MNPIFQAGWFIKHTGYCPQKRADYDCKGVRPDSLARLRLKVLQVNFKRGLHTVTRCMKNLCRAFVALIMLLISVPSPCSAQGCHSWAEALAKSFFPHQIDQKGLHEFASVSPEEYFQEISKFEEEELADSIRNVRVQGASDDIQHRLTTALKRFYAVGSQLYGVQLNPNNVGVVPEADINAFATGSHIFMNAALIQYFLRPADYLAGIVRAQNGEIASGQYRDIQADFPWQDDWDSIYFVLAHEASHNLMRHRDAMMIGPVLTMFADYEQSVTNYRKDLANGHTGGVKRYLWQSMKNFSQEIENAEQQRDREVEADTVGLLILQGSGFNPEVALIAAERMDMLLGGGNANGWQAGMTEVLCSTHPDWIVRIQKMQTSLICLRSTGELCENHAPYPVENLLSQLREGMARLDSYQEETVRVADGKSSSTEVFEAEIKVDPKAAIFQIDGRVASPGKVHLPLGPHTVSVARDGYRQQELQITVFPDVQPKIKVKLKKL